MTVLQLGRRLPRRTHYPTLAPMPDEPTVNPVNPVPTAARSEVRDALDENFDDLRRLLDRLLDDQLDARLAPREWSVREILLHVIHSERWIQPQLLLLRRAVAPQLLVPQVGGVTLPDPDANPSLAELRWGLTVVREDTLRLLERLSHDQLREPANMELDGDIVDTSIRTLAFTAADHQLFHLRQIQRTLGLAR